MKRPSIYVDRGGYLDVKMTPMIDVVFLLLIFFVWTASFQIVEHLLPSRLIAVGGEGPPTDLKPDMEDFDQVVVRLLWDRGEPIWLVNDTPRASLQEVGKTLETLAEIKTDIPVILDPAAEVPLGHVIDVYDLSRQVGFRKIQFAASEEI